MTNTSRDGVALTPVAIVANDLNGLVRPSRACGRICRAIVDHDHLTDGTMTRDRGKHAIYSCSFVVGADDARDPRLHRHSVSGVVKGSDAHSFTTHLIIANEYQFYDKQPRRVPRRYRGHDNGYDVLTAVGPSTTT
jgi:hypothetical protein